jgi:ubiquinone biosynthesis protein COQ9
MQLDSKENKRKILTTIIELINNDRINIDNTQNDKNIKEYKNQYQWDQFTLELAFNQSNINKNLLEIIFPHNINSVINFWLEENMLEIANKINEDKLFHQKKIGDKISHLLFLFFWLNRNNKIAIKKIIKSYKINGYNDHKNSFKFYYHQNQFINEAFNKLNNIKDILSSNINNNNHNLFIIIAVYKIANEMWFIARDSSTDINFYSKRLILAKIIFNIARSFINDNTDDLTKTKQAIDFNLQKITNFTKRKHYIKSKINNIADKIHPMINKINDARGNQEENQDYFLNNVKNIAKKLPFLRLIKRK